MAETVVVRITNESKAKLARLAVAMNRSEREVLDEAVFRLAVRDGLLPSSACVRCGFVEERGIL